MARPLKEGMDYFPHDTDASNDEKIEALRALYGNDGYAFYFILLERIYRTADAELDISKPAVLAALVKKIGVSTEKFKEMLETAFEIECLDREAYEQRNVLTSKGIKRRAAEVQGMRERWRKQKENSRENSEVFREENPVENSGENAEETPERKEKKNKENKNNVCVITPPISPPTGGNAQAVSPPEPSVDALMSRYTPEQQRVINKYFDVIRFTRKSARVSDSVKIREMQYWERYPPDVVIKALLIHINRHPEKREEYARGIIRRMMHEIDFFRRGLADTEGVKLVGDHTAAPRADPGEFAEIDFSKFEYSST